MMLVFGGLFLFTYLTWGYLVGRFRAQMGVGGYVVTYVSTAVFVVARNFGKTWWWVASAPGIAIFLAVAFALLVGRGARASGRRVILVQGNRGTE